ncbi:flavin monoamine oxidase family protein [Kitasatospora sp. NBC_01266]|uniref:flavin monoamine oxidase family protein n=1 Tax=Kitasatospora sp. NBC_01266 TaxID=2903572 RepID=UPI002E314D64|nr:NAD(P)/FAD-dependent oxidoreductase [Kitasatospora sp. NBC_01266]
MFDESFAYPHHLLGRTAHARHRVAVIGAGVAGLVCAYELHSRGFEVALYERSNQPGGRVRTHRFWDGTHADLGAMRIPGNHHCVLHYVRRFKLATRPFVNHNPAALYHLRGHRARVHDAHTLFPAFALRPAEQQSPAGLLDRLLGAVWTQLGVARQLRVLGGRWDDPALEPLLSVSLWQFVSKHLSQEAWDLVGHASGLTHYEQSSLLEVLVDYFGLFHTSQLELVDGTDTLIRAFVRELPPDTLRLSTRVDELAVTATGVTVHGARLDRPFTDHADFAVCCVPAPLLERITVRPGLPHPQRHAIRGISYASSAKTLLHLTRRRWESQDGIFGGGSFTDLPIQQCWYPSDNARPAAHRIDGRAGPHWVARDRQRSEEPAALLGAYLWGANARRFTALAPADRDRLVLDCLEQLHPGIRADVDDIVHWNWDEQVGTGGAFAHLAPGEHLRHLAVLGDPHPLGDPRIFFAGEHLSGAHAWCQGAAQSALAAVSRLLDRGRHVAIERTTRVA